jgi:hypothetical protein
MINQMHPYEPLTSQNAALVSLNVPEASTATFRRAETQCSGPSQSGESAEAADHVRDNNARLKHALRNLDGGNPQGQCATGG